MTPQARVWEIVENVGVGMLTTRFAGGLRARPIEPRCERDAGVIWILTDARSGKDDEIEADSEVCLIVIDGDAKAYLSITGRARVLDDHAKATGIWRRTDNIWWQGPDDPNVRVIRLDPERAELWDGPADVVLATFELAKARLTGNKPNLGENRKVTIELKR
jgi:general stress protein 26